MPPPAVLRKRHTLTGKDIFPLIKRVRGAESPAGPLARLKMNAPTETMTISEMKTAFRELSGESLEECLQMVGDTANIEEGMKKLLHYAIIYANEVGQPDGQDISQDEQQVGEPQAKKQKKEHALEKRIEELEQSKRNEGEEELKSLKAKVRGLCMQTEPSVPLILVLVEELASTARKMNSDDAAIFEELARQANCNKEKLDIPSFCLSVLGGKATDVVGKALSKALKVKSECGESSVLGKVQATHQSPMLNLYSQPPQAYWGFGQGNFVPQMYPYGGVTGYGGYRKYQRGSGRGQSSRGNCLFCGGPDHYVRDCMKMKAARDRKSVV